MVCWFLEKIRRQDGRVTLVASEEVPEAGFAPQLTLQTLEKRQADILEVRGHH